MQRKLDTTEAACEPEGKPCPRCANLGDGASPSDLAPQEAPRAGAVWNEHHSKPDRPTPLAERGMARTLSKVKVSLHTGVG
jgi:hypothetical protein